MSTVWKVLGFIVMLVVIIIAGGIGKEIGHSAVKKHSSDRNDSAIEEKLTQASNSLNQRLPMTLDKQTRIESTFPGPGKKWTYLFTLVSIRSSDMTQQQLQDGLGENIKRGVCTSKEMLVFIKGGVQFVYRYRGSDGGVIGDIVVNPSDCQ